MGHRTPLTRQDHRLPIERQPIAEFADQHIGDQAGPRSAAFDRQVGRRRLEHGLAFAACIAWADMADHLEPSWDFLQHFGDIFTKAGQPGAVAVTTDADNLAYLTRKGISAPRAANSVLG